MENKTKKPELLTHLQSDYKSSEVAKHENDDNVSKWENIRDSKPYGTEVAHKSKYVSDMTNKLLSWQIPSIVEPLVNSKDIINCKPFTHADVARSEQEEAVLTYQAIQTLDHYSFVTDLVTTVAEKGTAFVKTGWEFEEEEREVEVPVVIPNPMTGEPEVVGVNTEMQMVTVKNRPTRVLVDPLDVRVDPTCRGILEKASFVIHDFETDISTLRKDPRYNNLDKLEDDLQRDYTYEERDTVDSTFRFSDDPRKKIIVHEYWGNYDLDGDGIAEPIVCAWVNDTIIRQGENPLPGKKLPFLRAVYKRVTGSIYGEALAALTEKNQHIDSVLHRGIFDDMKLANNGQTGVKKGFTDSTNLKKMKQGLDFEYNTTMADVYEDSYKPLNQSVFQVLDRNESSAESSVGVSAMNHGTGGNALGSSAAAVNATTTSSAKREMHIVRGIAEECIIPMLKLFSEYNQEFLEPEEVMRITDKPFVPLENDNSYDIKIVLESAETRAAKAQSTGFVLQTMGPNMPQAQQQTLLARYMKLVGEPDIAKQIEEYQPQPDPMAMKMQELEIAKLEAQVSNERAKAAENEADIALKKAKTREINANSDITDLDFIEKEQGIPHQREMEKQAQKDENDFVKKQADNDARLAGVRSKVGA